MCGSQFLRVIWIDGLAHLACSTHDVVFRVKTMNDGREVFIDPSAEIVPQKGASVSMIHDQVVQ